MNAPRYPSRRPGCNPRTGEKLPRWQEVQVSDPTRPSYTRVPIKFAVQTENGSRLLVLKVPYTGYGLHDTAVNYAKSFGFQVLNVVD